nr:SGNH/GDSL hydrolase family protein [Streptomyces sp. Ru72]
MSGVDVVPAAVTTGTVVTFGDSITDGYHTTFDANRRWPDRLAARLQAASGRPAALCRQRWHRGQHGGWDAGWAPRGWPPRSGSHTTPSASRAHET